MILNIHKGLQKYHLEYQMVSTKGVAAHLMYRGGDVLFADRIILMISMPIYIFRNFWAIVL